MSFLLSILIGTVSDVIMLGVTLSSTTSVFAIPTVEKIKMKYSYPLLVVAMKSSMHEYVENDEDIRTVEEWIYDGRNNDFYFKKNVLPIMINDCSSCHSRTATEPRAISSMPLTKYEDIVRFSEAGYTWGKMARQAHMHLFGISGFLLMLSIIMSLSSFSMATRITLISTSSIALWVDVLGWWMTKYYSDFAYVIFVSGIILCVSIVSMCLLCAVDLCKKPSA